MVTQSEQEYDYLRAPVSFNMFSLLLYLPVISFYHLVLVGKTMKRNWFKRYSIFFIPATLTGWIFFLATLAVVVLRFIQIDRNSHSASDTLRPFFLNMIIIWGLYSIVALLTSDQK